MAATPLSAMNTTSLKPISTVGYDRSELSAGILHIGVGNFHRAHQAIYLDRLFEKGLGLDWAIVGAGLRPGDAAMRADLARQDWMTTVVELDPTGLTARQCGSMINFVETNPQSVIKALLAPEIRIVSLTITEGGYFVDAETDGFDISHPEIQHDISNPESPASVFGCLIAALKKRRDQNIEPFTIMSCDNLPENGHVARNALVGLAKKFPGDIGDWIETHVACPNGMVDCITPATSDRERSLVSTEFGIDEARPVVCEPFRQWVLEDNFPTGRPPLEQVGVEFVEDVAPHELMKLRILNGGHAAIAYPAGLLGIHFVHDAMAHPLINGYLNKLVKQEITPTVPAIKGVDFAKYFDSVVGRFSNSAVGDTIPRLCFDGSNRQPKFILPAIQDRLTTSEDITGLSLEVALWCRYCAGVDETGKEIVLEDELAADLKPHAIRAKDDPKAFLELTQIFGTLGEEKALLSAFASSLNSLWTDGVETTLQRYIDS